MLGNGGIDKIHARQGLYIWVYILGKIFLILSISLLYPKEFLTSNFKTAWKNLRNFLKIFLKKGGSDFPSHENGEAGKVGGFVLKKEREGCVIGITHSSIIFL